MFKRQELNNDCFHLDYVLSTVFSYHILQGTDSVAFKYVKVLTDQSEQACQHLQTFSFDCIEAKWDSRSDLDPNLQKTCTAHSSSYLCMKESGQ